MLQEGPHWAHLTCVGHTFLLKGNALMRQAALQRLTLCCSDELLPDYIEHKVCNALETLVRGEQDESVRRALHECIAAFAESPLRRQLLQEARVGKALQESVGTDANEHSRRAVRACTQS